MENSGLVSLSGGEPAGGTYSGLGINNGIFNPEVAGVGAHVITYVYTDSSGCTDSAQAEIVVTNPTDISTVGSASVQLFPNPATGWVNLVINNAGVTNLEVEFFDNLGQRIDVEKYRIGNHFSTGYDLSLLPGGLYYFKIKLNNESRVFKITVTK